MSGVEVLAVVLAAIDISFRLIALVIVPRNRRPQTSMAWLLAIFFIPFVAFFAFLAFGSHRLSPTRRRKQDTTNRILEVEQRHIPDSIRVAPAELELGSGDASASGGEEQKNNNTDLPLLGRTTRLIAPLVQLNERLGQMAMVRGNQVTLHSDYQATLEDMIADVDRAQHTVHVLFYIMSVDEVTEGFFASLARARERGVEVRVLFDQVATARIPGSRALGRRLREAGVDYRAMLPFQPWRGVYQRPDLRNHRKLLVIDTEVAYTGSQNIIEPGYRRRGSKGLQWSDLMARVEGPLVHSLEALFVTDWYQETDTILETPELTAEPGENSPVINSAEDTWAQVVPSGPAFEGENNLRLFNGLMYQARKRIVIVSPYLVPDDSMRYAITSAALRGVRVDVYVSAVGDQPLVFYAQRSYYGELLRAGVHIWLYPAPTVLHSKFIVVDGEVAVMGTSNLDMRSFTLNLELSVLLIGQDIISRLESLAENYREASTELTTEKWNQRGQVTRFVEGLARLTATVQ